MFASTIVPKSAIESPDWQLADADGPKPASLVVQLRRGAFVFPWFRFVYAEGDNTRVTIIWTTHAIQVTGHGLAALLAALSGHRVIRLIEPSEHEGTFDVRGPAAAKYNAPVIRQITVTKFE
jgi:hypothetical protein